MARSGSDANSLPSADLPSSTADWTRVYRSASGADDAGEAAQGEEALQFMAGAKEWASWLTGCSHDHAAERRIYDMPRADQLACCAVYRKTGTAYYSEGAYARALERYQRALVYYEYALPEPPAEGGDAAGRAGLLRAYLQEVSALSRVRLSCLLNSAACYLRLEKPEDAVSILSQALRLCDEWKIELATAPPPARTGLAADDQTGDWPTAELQFERQSRIKALFRRAAAYLTQHDFEAADADCKEAARLVAQGMHSPSGEASDALDPAAGAPTSLDTDDEAGEEGDGEALSYATASQAFLAGAQHSLAALRRAIAAARKRYDSDIGRMAASMFAGSPS